MTNDPDGNAEPIQPAEARTREPSAEPARDGWSRAAACAEENREAIAAHASFIEEHGVPLAAYRMF